jgi:hypothetical protein
VQSKCISDPDIGNLRRQRSCGCHDVDSPVHAANGSVAYTYDALGRVTTASYDTGVCIIYTVRS